MACTVNPAMGPNTPTIPHENETRGQDHVRGAIAEHGRERVLLDE